MSTGVLDLDFAHDSEATKTVRKLLNSKAPGEPTLRIDFETRGVIDLKRVGADRYAEDPDTGVWCMAWAIEDDPVEIWLPGQKMPAKVLDHIESGGTVSGWNISFEMAISEHVMPRICPEWPGLRTDQVDDTMARSYARACPGMLEKAAIAVNVPFKKDAVGHKLMLKYCKPTLAWKKKMEGPPQWHNDPAELEALYAYCKQDVEVERALSKQLAPLSESERKIFMLDRLINQRGVAVDTPKVQAALEICDAEKDRLNAELEQLTDGEVKTANQVPLLTKWLAKMGVELENMKKRPLSRLLKADRLAHANDPDLLKAKRAIEIRLESAKASTAKLKAMIVSQSNDGRCRGLFSYHVATTGRWAGRRIQLHNFPRPHGIFDDDRQGQANIDSCLEMFGAPNAADSIRICYEDPLPAVASCLRGLIIPGPGKKFVGGDFTGIENRVLMWLAGEHWMIEEFRKFDAGCGQDNYKLCYAKSFGVPIESVTKPQRLIGKVGSLACGFAGAVGAYIGMGDNYDDFRPGDVARAARESTSDAVWRATAERYPKEEKWRFKLDCDTWTGIRVVVDAWRSAHLNVTDYWWDLTDSAMAAVLSPKKVVFTQTGLVKFAYNGQFLFCQLPSGRCLAYARPSVVQNGNRAKLMYFGLGKKSKRWEQRELTANILSENTASGTARDALTDAMLRLEDRGYSIPLHVHDEAVSEVDLDFGSPEEFEQIMCASRPWMKGLPIAAAAWEGDKFRK
jgi:DNA polymerase